MPSNVNCTITVSNGYEMAVLITQAISTLGWPVAVAFIAWLIYAKHRREAIEIFPPARKGK